MKPIRSCEYGLHINNYAIGKVVISEFTKLMSPTLFIFKFMLHNV